jgi:hypothetical protein
MTTFSRDRRFVAVVAGAVLGLFVALLIVMAAAGCQRVHGTCTPAGPSQSCPSPSVTP